MSTFTFNVYLVQDIDGDGTNDYVLQDEGRIIISTQSITVDTNYRYIGGQIARKPGSRPAFTFKIKKRPDNTWYLIVNEATFCGLYANQDDCFGVLYGYYTSFSGSDDGFAVWLADSLEKGSVIDPDGNVVSIAEADPEVEITIENFNYADAVGSADVSGGVYMVYETSVDGVTWSGISISNVVGAPLTAGDDGSTIARTTSTGVWANVPEDGYVRACIAGADSGLAFTCLVTGDPIGKNDSNDTDLTGLSLSISDADVEGNPIYVGGYAEAYPDESGAVLDIGETITYDAYQWFREIPALTDLTNDAGS